MEFREDKDSYNVLLVSDIHDNIENVKKLVKLNKDSHFDFIIDCGDTTNLPIGKNNDQKTCDEYLVILKSIHEELSKLGPIFWVPGNHEAFYFYEEKSPEISPKTINLHKKTQKLSNNLYLVGLGGSVPILTDGAYNQSFVPFKTLDKKKFKHIGYPYNVTPNDYEKSDEIYGKDVEEVLKKVKEEGGEGVNIILLTHCGPLYTSTNYIIEGGEVLHLGSEKLGNILEREKNILINCHGHSHSAEGIVVLDDNKMVINPGTHRDGKYAKFTIRKKENDQWSVGESTIGYL